MSELACTFCECPFCGETVRASRHIAMDCRKTIIAQRDEAREFAKQLIRDISGDPVSAAEWFEWYSTGRPWLTREAP